MKNENAIVWAKTAKRDLEASALLFRNGFELQALYFARQSLEKIGKSIAFAENMIRTNEDAKKLFGHRLYEVMRAVYKKELEREKKMTEYCKKRPEAQRENDKLFPLLYNPSDFPFKTRAEYIQYLDQKSKIKYTKIPIEKALGDLENGFEQIKRLDNAIQKKKGRIRMCWNRYHLGYLLYNHVIRIFHNLYSYYPQNDSILRYPEELSEEDKELIKTLKHYFPQIIDHQMRACEILIEVL